MFNKTAYLFSGGGAQYPGMMKELAEIIPQSREIFEKADEALGFKLSEIIFHGTQDQLNSTEVMLPAIFVADMAAYTAASSIITKPQYALGFSLGEWAAITAAEVIPFETAVKLVRLRSVAMAEATPKEGAGMAVIMGKPNSFVEQLCSKVSAGYVCPANYNYPGQVTVSGTDEGLLELECLAVSENAIYKKLPVNVPSHCKLMLSAMKKLETALNSVVFNSPKFPIVSNYTAAIEIDPEKIKKNLILQLVSPVKFEQSIHSLTENNVDCFIELGPGKTLTGFVKKILRNKGIEGFADHIESLDTLAAVQTRFESKVR